MGGDVTATWHAGDVWTPVEGLRFSGSLTVQRSEIDSGAFSGNDTPFVPDGVASWRVAYERSGWLATLGGTYMGESFADQANTAVPDATGSVGLNPARTLWDLRLAKEITPAEGIRIEVAAGINNLFGEDWFFRSQSQFFAGGMHPQPGRDLYFTFLLSANW
jgi:outer membrane receptor for Fe3+-dicitrate